MGTKANMIEVDECMKNVPNCLENIDSLKSRMNKNDVSDNYEKQENGKFHLKLNGEELNLDLDQEHLVSALELTYKIINLYMKSGYNGEKLYAEETIGSKGGINRASIIDLKIDNRPILDTTFLSEEGFRNNFLLDPTRKNGIMEEYAYFLNKVLIKEFKINKK